MDAAWNIRKLTNNVLRRPDLRDNVQTIVYDKCTLNVNRTLKEEIKMEPMNF